jgi:hypothetical protein
MAKYKRKVYSTQRDKLAIDIAKKLKAAGIISKQAKLHGGRYISREVLAKVREHQHAAALNYGTVKVSKEIARAAKERGYQVVQGNRIIGPKTPIFRKRLQAGSLTGVKPIKGGYMEEITLPHTIYDMRTLIEALGGDGINTLKQPGEMFAFKYKGAESYRTFKNSKALMDYLLHYKGVDRALASNRPEDLQEEFNNLVLFRLHPADERLVIPDAKERRRRNAERRAEAIRRGEYVIRRKRKSWSEKLANMPDWRATALREGKRKRAEAHRASLTGEELERYKEAAKARAKASRDKKKKG